MDTLRELTSDVSSTAISDFRAMAEETAGWRVTAAMQRSGPRDSFRGYGGLHHVTRAVFNSGGCVEGSSQIPGLDVEAAMRVATN